MMMSGYSLGGSDAEKLRLQRQRLLYDDTRDLQSVRGDVVCELGCGPFANSWLATGAKSYIGIDIDNTNVVAARHIAFQLGLKQATFFEGDAVETGLPDNFADLVFIRCLLVHVGDPERIIKEARRILNPDGRLVVIEPDDFSVFATPGKKNLLRCWQARLEFCARKYRTNPTIGRELYTLFHRAGLRSIATDAKIVQHRGSNQESCRALMTNWMAMIEPVAENLVAEGLVHELTLEAARRECQDVTPDAFATLTMWRAFAIK